MSLESDVRNVREFLNTFKGMLAIGDALEAALAAEGRAKACEKRALIAQDAEQQSKADKATIIKECEAMRAEAAKAMADAKRSAEDTKKDAKSKADAAVAKANAKIDQIEKDALMAQAKFDHQTQTNKEILDMQMAQIAHGEAKLTEIREAIAKLTKA